MLDDIKNIDNLEDFEQFMAELVETQNLLRWAMYDSVYELIKKGISQGRIAKILGCSQAKISQYAKSAQTFPEETRHLDIPVSIYDACRDTKDSSLAPIQVLEKAIEEELSPRQIREYIEGERPKKKSKKVIRGSGILSWEGNKIEIIPEINDDNIGTNSITTNGLEITYMFKEK